MQPSDPSGSKNRTNVTCNISVTTISILEGFCAICAQFTYILPWSVTEVMETIKKAGIWAKRTWTFILFPSGLILDLKFVPMLFPNLELPALPAAAVQFLFVVLTVAVGGAFALLQVGVRRAPLNLLEITYPTHERYLFYAHLVYCMAWSLLLMAWQEPASTLFFLIYSLVFLIYILRTIERLNLSTPYHRVRSKGSKLVNLMKVTNVDSRGQVQSELRELVDTLEDALSSGEAAVANGVSDAIIDVLKTYLMNKTHYRFLVGSDKNDHVFEQEVLKEITEILTVCARLQAYRSAETVIAKLTLVYKLTVDFELSKTANLIFRAELEAALDNASLRMLLINEWTKRFEWCASEGHANGCIQIVDSLKTILEASLHSNDEESVASVLDSLGVAVQSVFSVDTKAAASVREHVWKTTRDLSLHIVELQGSEPIIMSTASLMAGIAELDLDIEWREILKLFQDVLTTAVQNGSQVSSTLVKQTVAVLVRRCTSDNQIKDSIRLVLRLSHVSVEASRFDLVAQLLLVTYGLVIDPERHPQKSDDLHAVIVPVLAAPKTSIPLQPADKMWIFDEITRVALRSLFVGQPVCAILAANLYANYATELNHVTHSALIKKLIEEEFPQLLDATSDLGMNSQFVAILGGYKQFLAGLDPKVGAALYKGAIEKLQMRALRGIWSSRNGVTTAVLQLLYEVRREVEAYKRNELSEYIVDTVFSIGVRGLEYGHIETLRSASNYLGWLTKQALDEQDGPFLTHCLSRCANLYRFCSVNSRDETLLVYLATLFVMLGTYTHANEHLQKNRRDLARAAAGVPGTILEKAAQFRFDANDFAGWIDLGSDPSGAFRNFLDAVKKAEPAKLPKRTQRLANDSDD